MTFRLYDNAKRAGASIAHFQVAVGQFQNKSPTNFSLSPGFDKLKLVGHQTDPLPSRAHVLYARLWRICDCSPEESMDGRT